MLDNMKGYVGKRGFSDGYEGTKRPRMMDSNPYFAVTGAGSSNMLEGGSSKRPRMASEPVTYFPMTASITGVSSSYQPYFSSVDYGRGSFGSRITFPVVRLRGLPFDCEDLDILSFFAGLNIVDCLLVNKNGRFIGEAYVVFASPLQAEIALQRDKHNMGRRYVEVFPCTKRDYYQAIAAEISSGGFFSDGDCQQGPPPARPKRTSEDKDQMEYTEVLKLRGLPYSVTKSEIVQFFGEEFGLKEENVQIICRPDGKATGEAYAEFASANLAKRAMRKDMMTIGTRYVELFPATPDEMARSRRFNQ